MGALHWAAAAGDEPCLAFLRERALDVDTLSWAGLSPLAYAARGGHSGAVRLLLADANPNVGARRGCPQHGSAWRNAAVPLAHGDKEMRGGWCPN